MKEKVFGEYYQIKLTYAICAGDMTTTETKNFETLDEANKYYEAHKNEFDGVWKRISKPFKKTIRVRFE